MNIEKAVQILDAIIEKCGGPGGKPGPCPGPRKPKPGRTSSRRRDAIEGTQKEADLEVKKANRAVQKVEKALAKAKASPEAKAIRAELVKVKALKAKHEKVIKASLARTNALKARLAEIQSQLRKSLSDQVADLKAALESEDSKRKSSVAVLKRIQTKCLELVRSLEEQA